jgi:hypothetical protein
MGDAKNQIAFAIGMEPHILYAISGVKLTEALEEV